MGCYRNNSIDTHMWTDSGSFRCAAADIMGVTTLIYGPVCAILYLREVKNGVFTIDEEEEADE